MGFYVAHPNDPQDIARNFFKTLITIKNGDIKTIPYNIRNQYSIEVVQKQMSEVLTSLIHE